MPATAEHRRYHALDALRASMMLLGLVLHSAASYTTGPLGNAWPFQDPSGNRFFDLLVFVIHLFRMPLFFLLAGFFAAMLLERRGPREFVAHPARSILLPLVVGWLLIYPLVFAASVYSRNALRPDPFGAMVTALRSGEIADRPDLAHLWFLYYLLLFYAAVIALRWLGGHIQASWRQRALARAQHLVRSPWRTALFALPTAVCLYLMPWGQLDTAPYLLPPVQVLAAYALFFGFGWFLYGMQDLLEPLREQRRRHLGAAAVTTGVLFAILVQIDTGWLQGPAAQLAAASATALTIWLLVLGLSGLFLHCASRPTAWSRYLADASYWIYLIHLPIAILLQGLIARAPLPVGVKFLIVLAVTVATTVVTYDLFVRPTAIGAVLNGRAYPRGLFVRRRETRPSCPEDGAAPASSREPAVPVGATAPAASPVRSGFENEPRPL